ncbi:MAG: anaerobic ribonucleoside-triphosphate reductase activating protein [Eubacteriales bacterium]
MKILGIIKASFIDYPKKASTVLFIGGCNFRCPYCHNPELVFEQGEELEQGHVLDFLQKRKKFIDGVVISGGEPTIHDELVPLIEEIKKLGYAIKLDTNGTNPKFLRKLIDDRLIDYIAMDIKGPLSEYKSITNSEVEIKNIEESINLIRNSNIDYEFRTTICKELLSQDQIIEIGKLINGAKRFCLQAYNLKEKILDENRKFTCYTNEEMNEFKVLLEPYIDQVILRV